jgi:hypothetical protein
VSGASAAETLFANANATLNAMGAILLESRTTARRAACGAVNGDDMKPPDGIEQYRRRELRGDDGPGDLEG